MEPIGIDIIEVGKWIFYIGAALFTLFGQAWAIWARLEKKFTELDKKRGADVEERNAKLDSLEREAIHRHNQLDDDVAKYYNDLNQLRHDMQLKFANTVSIEKLEAVLDRRVGGIEGKLERFEAQMGSLIVELARLGVQPRNTVFPRPSRASGNGDDQD